MKKGSDSMDSISLRPHHGMCLAYFIGHGYSDGFTAHMNRILTSLTPDTPVRLVVKTDSVCTACPNNIDGRCDKPDLVAGYDHEVLTRCGLREDMTIPFQDFTALVQKQILTPGLRSEICGSCQWSEICDTQPSRFDKPK